ncbi:MAG: hypothetical protein ABW252_04940 [Polyangiales bacterium]
MSRSSRAVRSITVVATLCAASACAPESASRANSPAPLALAESAGTRSAAPFGCAGARIALQTKTGFYVGAFFGGGFGMVCTARSVGEPERFTSIDLGDARVALQASSGHYVVADFGGGGSVYANESRLSAATPFLVRRHWDDASVTLRTPSDWFLSALLGGGTVMNTNTRAAGDWEALRVTCLDGELDEEEQPDAPVEPEEPSDDWPTDGDDTSVWEDDTSPGAPGLGG